MAECDVLVLGAGVAGLSAASVLATAGLDVLVLEGASRVGGRLRSASIGGTTVELGANWIQGTVSGNNPVQALATELGLDGIEGDDAFEDAAVLCAHTGRALDEDGSRRRALESAREAVLRAARDAPDRTIAAAMRDDGGWQARDALDRAFEWLAFDFELGESAERASVLHNVLEETTLDEYGEACTLCTDGARRHESPHPACKSRARARPRAAARLRAYADGAMLVRLAQRAASICSRARCTTDWRPPAGECS